jgi:hypothetical protein
VGVDEEDEIRPSAPTMKNLPSFLSAGQSMCLSPHLLRNADLGGPSSRNMLFNFRTKTKTFRTWLNMCFLISGLTRTPLRSNGANPIIAMPHISDFTFRPRLQLSIAPPSAFRSKCYADIHVNCPRGKKGGMIFNCLTVGVEGRLALEAAVPPSSPNPSLSLPCDV